jgi:divalent metal cation (Fe/Co/Zn/Cd) transporter
MKERAKNEPKRALVSWLLRYRRVGGWRLGETLLRWDSFHFRFDVVVVMMMVLGVSHHQRGA